MGEFKSEFLYSWSNFFWVYEGNIWLLQIWLLVICKQSEWPLHSHMSMYLCTYSLVIDPEWHPRDNDNHEARNIYGKDEKRQLPGKNQFNTKTTVRAWNSQKNKYHYIDVFCQSWFIQQVLDCKGPTVAFFLQKNITCCCHNVTF